MLFVSFRIYLQYRKHLMILLPQNLKHLSCFWKKDAGLFIAGWGKKKSGKRAQWLSSKVGSQFLLLEDGFLRSTSRNKTPLSIVVDDLGIYYDASQPSRLENLIKNKLTNSQKERARQLIQTWCEGRVSKYNASRDYDGNLPKKYVLVVDQIYGGVSISYGLATSSSFTHMLETALKENPNSTIIVKVHPDTLTNKKKGFFSTSNLMNIDRVKVITENCHPARLIEHAETIYTVTSQIGFEALLWGKKVRCFGMPFYAGWGLTHDELPAPIRRSNATLEQVVHAALIDYPRYINPEHNELCEVETVLSHIALQRKMQGRFPEKIYAIGFSRWKKPILKLFFNQSNVKFVNDTCLIPQNATVAFWGNVPSRDLPKNTKLIRIEDGFLRSVGLGAELTQPLSWVMDQVGLYYDASQPSELENILQNTSFSNELLAQARNLREKIVDNDLTKYNLKGAPWKRPTTNQLVILVPGQVESDASIQFGSINIKTNIGLLKTVRQRYPEAYIVYKPHPDVVAGLRRTGCQEDTAQQWCNEIVTNVGAVEALSQVDEVHTLTSLIGFEALLRNKPVVCYGQPFYAGWGLTHDKHPIVRRTRKLSLDELVAGNLILYPAYVNRYTGTYITAEQAVKNLLLWRKSAKKRKSVLRWVLRYFFILSRKVKIIKE